MGSDSVCYRNQELGVTAIEWGPMRRWISVEQSVRSARPLRVANGSMERGYVEINTTRENPSSKKRVFQERSRLTFLYVLIEAHTLEDTSWHHTTNNRTTLGRLNGRCLSGRRSRCLALHFRQPRSRSAQLIDTQRSNATQRVIVTLS